MTAGKFSPGIAQSHFVDLVTGVIKVTAIAVEDMLQFVVAHFTVVQFGNDLKNCGGRLAKVLGRD
jgi:hypothetical protein